MTRKQEIALEAFRTGFNCAQSVISVFVDQLGYNYEQAMQTASGFGRGMGKLQATCGAATGAFMVIGLYTSGRYPDISVQKVKNNEIIQAFNKQFMEQMGARKCIDILGVDLSTREGQLKFEEDQLKSKVCEKCVATAVNILEELLELENFSGQ